MKTAEQLLVDPAPQMKSYDPKNVRITFNGIEIQGYSDGGFVGHKLAFHALSNNRTYVSGEDKHGRMWALMYTTDNERARRVAVDTLHRALVRADQHGPDWRP